MSRFYKELRAGAEKAAAFRSATRAIREHRPHPFYWAPFVLIGDPGANV
jgi:CHAT domain-containing protein